MRLTLLGTGASVSDPHRTVTMLAVQAEAPTGARSTILIDCGGDVIQRALAAGVDPETIDHVIITHEHADHTSGFALMVQKLWLAGRRRPIPIHGIGAALAQVRRIWKAFDTKSWEEQGLPDLLWQEFPHEEGAFVWEDETWRVTSSPADHSAPTAALRIEHLPSGKTLAYSSDTAPSPMVARLARGADVLVHEANGHIPGVHASAEEAARVAAEAGAGRLLLVHLPPELNEAGLGEARAIFGETHIGDELGDYDI